MERRRPRSRVRRRLMTALGLGVLLLVVISSIATNVIYSMSNALNGSSVNDVGAPLSPHCGAFPARAVDFNPRHFMENGPGKTYLELYQKQLNTSQNKNPRRKQQRLLKVRFVVYEFSTKTDGTSCLPIYYHIHKNGGSSMNFRNPPGSTNGPRIDPYYTPREQELGQERFENRTLSILRQVHMDQTEHATATSSMPLFTFLRDPVPRFLSSVGQALRLNKLGACTRQSQQPQKDTLTLLDCVLTLIQDSESFLDEHLEPQIFELYHGMMNLDLRVNVLDLSSMDTMLDRFLGLVPSSDTVSRRRRRSGPVMGYNLSTALLPPRLIHRICKVYQMDVELLRTTKVSATLCTN